MIDVLIKSLLPPDFDIQQFLHGIDKFAKMVLEIRENQQTIIAQQKLIMDKLGMDVTLHQPDSGDNHAGSSASRDNSGYPIGIPVYGHDNIIGRIVDS